MPYPPVYERDFSFAEWQALHPGEPLPGVNVDTEFDDVAVALTATQANLALIQRADGQLQNGIVGADQLDPTVFEDVADDIIAEAQTHAAAAAASATQAQNFRNQAQTAAVNADADAAVAAGAISTTEAARLDAEDSASTANSASIVSQNASIAAANDASHAEQAATFAEMHADQAFKWAEYLAGPVEPAPPGWPEAVDDGMFSAKWWAVRAMNEFSQFGKFFLGAFNDPPLTMADGSPLIPGAIYYDLDTQRVYVWTGTDWASLETPGPSALVQLAYSATAGQTVFNLSVPSLSGATWVLHPGAEQEGIDVHVNGAKKLADVTGPLGDYTVDHVANTVTLLAPAALNDLVQIDVLVPPSQLAPGAVLIKSVADLDVDWDGSVTGTPGQDGLIDGTRTVFQLREDSPPDSNPLITPASAAEIAMFVDGVRQRPGVDFQVAGSTLTFAVAPRATAIVWALWYAPGGGGGLGGDVILDGGIF